MTFFKFMYMSCHIYTGLSVLVFVNGNLHKQHATFIKLMRAHFMLYMLLHNYILQVLVSVADDDDVTARTVPV